MHREGIQLLVTALEHENDARYLNLRLRFEQQRLFAGSKSSGLLGIDGKDHDRILNSNALGLHRQTVLDIVMQIQCLFNDFTKSINKFTVLNDKMTGLLEHHMHVGV